MAQDWNIRPRGQECMGCHTPFEDGQICCSALIFAEDGYRRADFCKACWIGKEASLGPFSSWQGPFKLPPPPDQEPLKKENAESLLRRLMEDETEDRPNVVFILAVMLERKKVLCEREVRSADGHPALRVYEHRETGETFLIPDPHLRIDELESVQQEVAAMLGTPREPDKQEQDTHARA